MAKINHNSFIDTVNDMLGQARQKKVMHLNFDADEWTGRQMEVDGRGLINFGTCGYLGLETDVRLIERSVRYAQRYGTQFSISRAYVASNQNLALEEKLSHIFNGHKAVVYSSTTLAHFAVMPIVIGLNDAIVLDQQAHLSMQTSSQLLAPKGVTIDVIRHNSTDMLERKILSLQDKCEKVWYVIDGVYSMYGDLPPYEELNQLAKKYPKLHFYVDDAHGMSWSGVNGSGCAFEKLEAMNRTILVTTMAKGFGSTGGIVVFPDDETYNKVLVYGGPLSYSHPIAASVMGASMASAEIHLSDEINELQNKLKERMNYCNELLSQTEIPVLSNPNTPIYFLGTGQPNVGFNMNKRILDEGYYVNLGIFPAVSIKNTGLRFTITNHVSKADIKGFVEALDYHYSRALSDEGRTINQVRRAFKLPILDEEELKTEKKKESGYTLKVYTRIEDIDKEVWDSCMREKAGCSWDNLRSVQSAYSGSEIVEENSVFLYYLVYDESTGKVVLATLFSLLLLKDDMFEPAVRSKMIESKRIYEPYFLTSMTYFMGTMLSFGDHLFVDDSVDWKEAFKLVLDHLSKEQERNNVNNIILRDFSDENNELGVFLYDMGYAKVDMPNNNVVSNLKGLTEKAFFDSLSSRSRRHVRNDVYKYQNDLTIVVSTKLSEEELERSHELLSNVSKKNLDVNMFDYPIKVLKEMNNNPEWEFIKIYLNGSLVSTGFCHRIGDDYFPVLVGIDYEANQSHKVYKQMLYQVVKRALTLKCNTIHFGLSADVEKKKLRADQIKSVAYLSVRDNFNFETLNNIMLNDTINT